MRVWVRVRVRDYVDGKNKVLRPGFWLGLGLELGLELDNLFVTV